MRRKWLWLPAGILLWLTGKTNNFAIWDVLFRNFLEDSKLVLAQRQKNKMIWFSSFSFWNLLVLKEEVNIHQMIKIYIYIDFYSALAAQSQDSWQGRGWGLNDSLWNKDIGPRLSVTVHSGSLGKRGLEP